MRSFLSLLSSLFFASSLFAQASADWQQRVEYQMEVSLQADRHHMAGHQMARYFNNSPDTLDRVFYHLYFNAFQPHSMLAERNRHLPDPDPRIVPRIFNLGRAEIGYHRIGSLTQDGRPVPFNITDTVMEVHLAEPIPPGGSAVFEMDFRSQVPLQTRRSGRDSDEGIDYSMTQWYPKLANYDERGWHADPYVGREFYAPFGTFDVRITLPREYVIGATGILQNAHEIGHGYDTTATVPETDSLTWHFHAENVHDFAWAADPDYIHDVITENGIDHHLLYQPDVAESWQGLKSDLPAMIEFFSEHFGEYPYPQMTVAQGGDGGMEYPMITLITGRRSPGSVLGVTAHEVAHMWYYGVLASNEAEYAWMDEGFTNYAATEAVAHLAGRPHASHLTAFYTVLLGHEYGLFEPLNTPSDWFQTNQGYSIASYSGGQMLVDMLGYVISDSLRDAVLLEYFDRFKFRHPNPYDVEKVAEDISGLRLDWYFEQFADTDWSLDMAVEELSVSRSGSGFQTEVEIEREGKIAVPVDLLLTYEDGSHQWVNIPLGIMQGHKPVPDGWIVAEPWMWTFPEYELNLELPKRVVRAEIDPTLHTPDVNRLNNVSRFPVEWAFLEAPPTSLSRYAVGWRPLLQYADRFGFGGGLQFRGTYLFDQFRTRAMLKLWPEVLFSSGEEPDFLGTSNVSAWDGVDFELSLTDHVEGLGPYGVASLRSQKHLGVLQNDLSFSTPLHKFDLLRDSEHRLTVGFRHQNRTSTRAVVTEPSRGFISQDMLSAHATYRFTSDRTRFVVRAELGGMAHREQIGSSSANKVYVDVARSAEFGPFTAGARVRLGWGAGNLALQKQYRLGTASFEDRWQNDAYRTVGAVFDQPLEDPHWVAFSGPGPVAYARTSSSNVFGSRMADAPIGNNVAAASLVLVAEPFAGNEWLGPLQAELFAGSGEVWGRQYQCCRASDTFSLDQLLFDAGIGIRYDVSKLAILRRWTAQSDVLSGLNLTAKFPIWASDEHRRGTSDAIDFRWLIGVTIDDAPWY